MSKWDKIYLDLCEEILEKGTRVHNRTGIDTIKIPFKSFEFDLEEEFPILTTKFVAFKSAVLELLWFYQAQSNDVSWLTERGVTIWDEWRISDDGIYRTYNPDGTIKSEKDRKKTLYNRLSRWYTGIRKNRSVLDYDPHELCSRILLL